MNCIIIGLILLIALFLLIYREFWMEDKPSAWTPITKDESTTSVQEKKEDENSDET